MYYAFITQNAYQRSSMCIFHVKKTLHILMISNNALINYRISKGNPFTSGSLIISILTVLTVNDIPKALHLISYFPNGLTSPLNVDQSVIDRVQSLSKKLFQNVASHLIMAIRRLIFTHIVT